jgi:DNA-binding MarR family transcriptional regulator
VTIPDDTVPKSRAAAPLEGLLTYRVSILAKLLDRRTVAMLSESCGLNVAEWRVLAQISEHAPSTVRWLAERMRVDRAEVSRAAAALEKRGLATRERDPADARSVLLNPTRAGKSLYKEIMPKRQALHRDLMATLPPEEAEDLLRTLDTLIERLTRKEAGSE